MSKLRVKVSDIVEIVRRNKIINSRELNDIEFLDDNDNVISIPDDMIKEHRFTGLNNVDFVTMSLLDADFYIRYTKLFNIIRKRMKAITDYYDNEIAAMALLIPSYLKKNKEKYDAMDGYRLGMLAGNFQYYVRLLKAESLDDLKSGDKQFIKNYNANLKKFPGIIEFVISEYQEKLETMKAEDPIKFFEYQREISPYFNKEE